jgi:hypothetical protein
MAIRSSRQHAAFRDLVDRCHGAAALQATSDRAGCTPRSGCGKAELLCTPICDS